MNFSTPRALSTSIHYRCRFETLVRHGAHGASILRVAMIKMHFELVHERSHGPNRNAAKNQLCEPMTEIIRTGKRPRRLNFALALFDLVIAGNVSRVFSS